MCSNHVQELLLTHGVFSKFSAEPSECAPQNDPENHLIWLWNRPHLYLLYPHACTGACSTENLEKITVILPGLLPCLPSELLRLSCFIFSPMFYGTIIQCSKKETFRPSTGPEFSPNVSNPTFFHGSVLPSEDQVQNSDHNTMVQNKFDSHQ